MDGGTGTAFAIEVADQQYLVTAKHMFGDNLNTKELKRSIEYKKILEINETQSEIWLSINAKIFFAENSDVAIIQLEKALYLNINKLEVNLSSANVSLGQDVFFFGFPYGYEKFYTQHTSLLELNENKPVPFIRKATLSAQNGNYEWLLSGQNIWGFSGGPAGFFDSEGEIHLLGIISGYYKGIGFADKNNLNTGIILCYDIKYALELISRIEN